MVSSSQSSAPPVPGSPQALLDLLERHDGVLEIPDPEPDVRAAWRRLLHFVRRDGHVPEGWHLRQRGRDVGDLVIEMRPGGHPARRYQRSDGETIPVPEVLVDPHPVVHAVRNESHRLPASDRNRSRALMVLEALAREAQRRGHTVRPGDKSSLMTIVAADLPYGIEIYEGSGARWTLRLVIRIHGPGKGMDAWADLAKRPVEHQLVEVLDEIGRRSSSIAAERENQRRREAERKQAVHDQAVTRFRARILGEQVSAWRLAEDIRHHCDELSVAGTERGDAWLRWGRRYADDVDPTVDPIGLPHPSDGDLEQQRRDERPPPPALPADHLRDERPWHPNRRWYHR